MTIVLASLLPAVVLSFILFRWNAFRVFGISISGALLSEIGMRKIFKTQVTLFDGSALVSALLFALWIPPALPSWMVGIGTLAGLVFGKEIFGGLGQNPFNPALVGAAFLYSSFPGALSEPPGLLFG